MFFLWQEHGAAFFLLAGLIALVLAMSAQFSRRAPAAAWLCAPYLLWLLFAAYLNLGVWLLNRCNLGKVPAKIVFAWGNRLWYTAPEEGSIP